MSGYGNTGIAPIFLQTAEQLVQRLSQDNTDKSRDFERRARAMVAIFQSWATAPPAPEARTASIHQLLDLQREVLDYFSARGREF
ncbi:MAG: hypothetical protein HUU21_34285 [Polyangiaceae bacterium]|nr:hypothetical protein [Polyangiaceae bacterium]